MLLSAVEVELMRLFKAMAEEAILAQRAGMQVDLEIHDPSGPLDLNTLAELQKHLRRRLQKGETVFVMRISPPDAQFQQALLLPETHK